MQAPACLVVVRSFVRKISHDLSCTSSLLAGRKSGEVFKIKDKITVKISTSYVQYSIKMHSLLSVES